MGIEPSLHVFTSPDSALLAALRERLTSHAQVRQLERLPRARDVGAGDVLVVDLDGAPQAPGARDMLPLLGRLDVWLVGGEQSVPPAWLEPARWPNVRLVRFGAADGAAALESLAESLRQQLVGPSGMEIAELVLAREPGLASVEAFVRVVCERTWEVRHPKQMAAALGTKLGKIKNVLRDLGFQRVEHFITYVRWVSFEQLVAVRRLRVALAQRLTGIKDPSNLRRQLERARRGSARALKRLKAG